MNFNYYFLISRVGMYTNTRRFSLDQSFVSAGWMHVAVTINVTLEDGYNVYLDGERQENDYVREPVMTNQDGRLVIGQYLADVRIFFFFYLRLRVHLH